MSKNVKQILKDKSNDYSKLEKEFLKVTGKSLLFDSCMVDEVIAVNPSVLSASIVIPAWNAESTILSCLAAIEQSSFNHKYSGKLQVIVTNDGSTDNTLKILKESKFDLNLTIVHQANHGQGSALNAGISVAQGDIIIEVDADIILNYYAIENIMSRHQFHKGALYTGFRFHVNDDDPRVSVEYIKENGSESGFYFTSDERIFFPDAGWPNNMCFASNHYKNLGNFKGLWMANDDNDDPWILADMVFGMLFSLPRDIFTTIGGFDERLKGWGCSDGLIGAKAVSEGVYIIPVYTATGFHITHPFRAENKTLEYNFNRKFFFEFINSTNHKKHPDWISKANKRIKNRFEKINKPKGLPKTKQKHLPMDIEHLLSLGKYNKAYKKILEENEKNDLYFFNLSKALIGLKRYEECIDLLRDRIDNKGNESEDLLFQLSMAYVSVGNFDKARLLLKRISEINSDYPELSYWLHRDIQVSLRQGIKYYNEKFYNISKKCFEAALLSDPKSKKALEYRKKCIDKNHI